MESQCHPGAEAVGTCSTCGQAVCRDCAVNVGGALVCRQCLAVRSLLTSSAAATDSTGSAMAIISLLLALLGAFACLCAGSVGGFSFGVPAMVLGYLARRRSRERGPSGQDEALATVGLALGAAEVVLSILIVVCIGTMYTSSLIASWFRQGG